MRKLNLIIGFIIFFLVGCSKGETDRVKIVEMTIYPETGYGVSVMSDIWIQPLIFSDSDENQRRLLIDIITEGFDFDYQRGYEYKFKAKKIWMQEPPQDVSSIKYEFVKLISKKKVITKDCEENIELFVSSEKVKFMPEYPNEFEDEETGKPQIYNALKVKVSDSDKWMVLTEIEGFDFEAGYEYQLRVRKVTQAEPYNVKYVLLEMLSKDNILRK